MPANQLPSGQQSLDGFDEPPPLTDRLFFALFPDRSAAQHIAQLGQELQQLHGLTGKLLRDDRFHITLHHIGDFAGMPQAVLSAACQAAATLAEPAFEVVLDRAASFRGRPGKHPFVLGADGQGNAALVDFHKALGTALLKAGIRATPGFTPHVTLLYGDPLVPQQAVTPIRWAAGEFVLVHSLLGKSVYTVMGRWPLTAQAGPGTSLRGT